MLLELETLDKTFSRAGRTFSAVQEVSLAVDQGEFVCIIGRSGSGKSTLLNMIAGLSRPTAGRVLLEDTDLYALGDADISRVRNTRMGFIPQGVGTLANLTVLDNVRLPYYLQKREGDPFGRAQFLLEEVGIAHLAGMRPAQLSGGELRRVLIARALMNAPDLLIADEPTSDLDVETTRDIMQLFAKINQSGTTVLLVTHELDTVAFASRVLSMVDGKLTEGALWSRD